MKLVNTLTLNPAIDKILFMDSLRKNITNRITASRETIGGKGTHVSINLKLLGMNSRAFGVCHGAVGERITDLLREYGLDVRFIHKDGAESRTNYLLVESGGDCTLVAEQGVALDDAVMENLFGIMEEAVCDEDYLVLSGDSSNCAPAFYKGLLERLAQKKLRVFLDTSGDALAYCVAASPFLIKPNLDELSGLCGRAVGGQTEDVLDAVASLDRYRIPVVAVSMGGEGSIVRAGQGVYRAVPPPVSVVNTIGCGDCYLAGLIYGFARKLPIEAILRVATGASAACAESPVSVGFDTRRAEELSFLTKIEKLA